MLPYRKGWESKIDVERIFLRRDAAGKIADGAYTYDAENRMITAPGATYTYDSLGRRVAKVVSGSSTEYLYDLQNRAVTEYAGTVWGWGEIYAGGMHLATYAGDTTNFIHSDWLGTKRILTGVSGAVSETCTNMPFGDEQSCTGTNWGFNFFTDDMHDPESNLEHTWFRQLSASEGRWLSPDPYDGSMDITNPQSFNRYVYVLNNPVNLRDPWGLDCAYLNDRGDDLESFDQFSNFSECGANGGYWVDGGLTNFQIDVNLGIVNLTGTTNGTDITSATYVDTTVNVDFFKDHPFINPFGHIGLEIGGGVPYGLNPASDFRFITGSIFGTLTGMPGVTVPGAITPVTTNPRSVVNIPVTGMQANMLQTMVQNGQNLPPDYTILGNGPACDCANWAQSVLSQVGIPTGPMTPVPSVLMNQLQSLYPGH